MRESSDGLPMSVRCAQLMAALLWPFVILGLVAASLSALLLIRLIREPPPLRRVRNFRPMMVMISPWNRCGFLALGPRSSALLPEAVH